MVFRALIAASLLTAATAHAQAPGDGMDGQPMGPGGYVGTIAPPSLAPPVTGQNPCGGGCGGGYEPVMARRLAVGLAVGSLSLAPQDQPDAKSEFSISELSLRYRATLHLELEVALAGGREKLADGTQGDREVNAAVAALRYRFNPERAWNWWVMGGLGGISVTSSQATDQERKDAQRKLGELGVGIERRFRRFALHAELRAINVAEDQNQGQPVKTTYVMPGSGGMQPPPPPPPPGIGMPSSAQSGGQLTIGASFYF
jgi:hypothetical protein